MDTPTGVRVMRADLAISSRLHRIHAVAMSSGAGARDPRCADGPAAFRAFGERALAVQAIELVWHGPAVDVGRSLPPLDAVARAARGIADVTSRLAARGERFVAIGGDHACAVGAWSGTAAALRRCGALGLIWIDAHMDMHTPETTHSGAINGMPLAALLGHGAAQLTQVAGGRPALDPRHVCLVGVRSFEPEEASLAQRLGVRVIDAGEVRRRGIGAVLAEARAIAAGAGAGFGVSLDLDALDPADAPGVGTPEVEGIRAEALLGVWAALTRACVGLEIAEYNPARDESGRTARLIGDLIARWAGEERVRWAG
jgi:arginase